MVNRIDIAWNTEEEEEKEEEEEEEEPFSISIV